MIWISLICIFIIHSIINYYLNKYFWKHVILDHFKDKGFEWNSDPLLRAIRKFLFYKTLGKKEEEKKKKVAKEIRNIFNQDKSLYKIEILLTYIQHKLGQKSKSHQTLSSIFSNNNESKRNNPLFKFQYAMYLMDKDELTNTEEHLKDIQSLDNFKLQALSYLAVVSEKEGMPRQENKEKYFNEAQKLSKNYKPLLKLQAQWNK